eukprot:jgi/Astpho2/9789/Aster-03762
MGANERQAVCRKQASRLRPISGIVACRRQLQARPWPLRGQAAADEICTDPSLTGSQISFLSGRCRNWQLTESEKDRLDEEVGRSVKECTNSIRRVEAAVEGAKAGLNAAVLAHRHGVALTLSDRLERTVHVFDMLRATRYVQLQKQQQKRRRLFVASVQEPEVISLQDQESQRRGDGRNGAAVGQQLDQLQLEEESQALQQALLQRSQQTHSLEQQMQEIAMLTHMFGTQVLKQAEQIELLYEQAVDQTHNFESGNVHLTKAIRLNSAARLWVIYILAIFTFAILFLDWWYS